ncbi:MAG: tRNA pseudouridine(38-40) synthase TruA [Rhizobiaceae bacterium]
MQRYKLTIAYNGARYCGWQRQVDLLSVQEALEIAFKSFCGDEVTIIAAGRTDAGVHASGQVVHVDLSKAWRDDVVRDAVNQYLVNEHVAILKVDKVDENFHARFSATSRHYVYKMLNRRSPPVFERGLVWHLKRKVDVAAMDAAAKHLVGRHDFSTFRDAECQAESPVRNLDRFDVIADGEMVYFHLSARAFLHRQVRSMVGSLEHVGSGKWTAADLVKILEAKDRAACGAVAPSDGLYLDRVDYG